MAINRFPETLLSEMFLVSMMITDFSFCSGVASLGSDCMLSWSLWMFRWFWIVNHQNCCSNNSSFMAGRVKHLCQEWSITIWLVLIKFWQVPWNVRLREWPIIGNGEAICVQVNTTWLIVTVLPWIQDKCFWAFSRQFQVPLIYGWKRTGQAFFKVRWWSVSALEIDLCLFQVAICT